MGNTVVHIPQVVAVSCQALSRLHCGSAGLPGLKCLAQGQTGISMWFRDLFPEKKDPVHSSHAISESLPGNKKHCDSDDTPGVLDYFITKLKILRYLCI